MRKVLTLEKTLMPPLGHKFDSLKYADIFLAPPRNRRKTKTKTLQANKSEM